MRTGRRWYGTGGDEGVTLQRLEPGGQDVRGDAIDLLGELAERAVAVEQGGDEAQAPAIPDLANGAGE